MRALLILSFLVPAFSFSQELSAKWTDKQLQIGEQTELKLILSNAPKKILYQPFSSAINCEMKVDASSLTAKASLELLENFTDTTFTRGGISYWEGTYRLTAWDTGTYILPLIRVALADSTLSVQPENLVVSFEKKPIGDGLEEVFEQYEEDKWLWLKKWWWLVFIPLAAVAIVLIRRKNEVKTVKTMSLRQRTQFALDALKKEEYWKKNQMEKHYMEFSFLLRSFLSARYELNLTEQTTYESMALLRRKGIEPGTLERIRELLSLSDIVKFAQGIPGDEETERGIRRFEELIVELSPLEIAP